MLDNLIITVENENFILVDKGIFNIERLLDLPYEELEQVINDLDMLDIEGLEELDIQEIIFLLCRKILQQKIEISELKARLA